MARMPTLSVHSPSRALRRTRDGGTVFDVTERRHPRFNLFERHWRFMLESYQGGPEYIWKGLRDLDVRRPGTALSVEDVNRTNLFRYFKEDATEHRERLLRAHRNNYTKKVVDQIRAFVARKPPMRREDEATEEVQAFWKDADGEGRPIDRFMAFALQWSEVFGSVWIHVDKPQELFLTAEEERREGMPFAKFYFPFDVLDAGMDDRNRLKWILVRESRRLDDSPFAPSPLVDHFVIWDKFTFREFIKNPDSDQLDTMPAIEVGGGFHGLGFVPFHQLRFSESEDRFVVPGLVDDIAGLDRDIFNKMSQLDTIVFDQTFSQLVMPTDGLVLNSPERVENDNGDVQLNSSREETRKRLVEMGTKRVFLFNGQTNHPPAYISPDATQADVVRQIIKDSISEIYRLAFLMGDVGREARTQTGVSKAYDFDRLNKVLAFIAQEMQVAEFWLADTVERWLQPPLPPQVLEAPDGSTVEVPRGTRPTEQPEDLVSYPENFDIMGLLEMLDIAFRADELNTWSPRADRLMREQVVARLLPAATLEDRKKILSDLKKHEKQSREMAERMPLDPAAMPDPEQEGGPDEEGDGRPTGENPAAPRGQDRSQVRGAGGGARRPNAGQPTRPTTQQARGA